MSTGAEFTSITAKKLLGYQDFGDKFLDYLREGLREHAERVFSSGAVHGNGLTIAADGADRIQIAGTDLVSDGIGNLIDISDASAVKSGIYFENAVGVDYYVALQRALRPADVQINPRSGYPEYSTYREILGRAGTPDLVTNNGATLTFRVNTITESGASNAGRQVLVYKNDLPVGATTAAVAIETATVAWSGGQNVITTTGLLGQDVGDVSTTPADYTVILLGPVVQRYTDPRVAGLSCFLGTVTGVGAGFTPSVFDTDEQELIPASLSTLSHITRVASNDRLKIEVKSIAGESAEPQITVKDYTGSTMFSVDEAGNVVIEGDLTVEGTTTQQDFVQVNASQTITDNLTAGDDAAVDTHLIKGEWKHTDTAGTANHFIVDGPTGRIGIARTPDTTAKLAIGGLLNTQTILPASPDTYNLGSPTERWANIYTANLSFSGDFIPALDNSQDLGTPAIRWAETHSVKGYFGDHTSVNLQHYLQSVADLDHQSLDEYCVHARAYINDASANTKGVYDAYVSDLALTGTGTSAEVVGYKHYFDKSQTSTVTSVKGFHSAGNTTAGTVTDLTHFRADNPAGAGTINAQYGLHVENLTRGTNNYGVYIAGASPGYALWVDSGTVRIDDNVAIGTTPATAQQLRVWRDSSTSLTQTVSELYHNITGASAGALTTGSFYHKTAHTTGDIVDLRGVFSRLEKTEAGDITSYYAFRSYTTTADAGDITNHFHYYADGVYNHTGTIGGLYGLNVATPTGSGTITSAWGVRIATQNAASVDNYGLYIGGASGGSGNNYSIWVDSGICRFDGAVGIGAAPAGTLHVTNGSDYCSVILGDNISTSFHITKESTDDSFNIWTGIAGSGTNRLKIDSNGKVGIGITTPAERLHLSSAADVYLKLTSTEDIVTSGMYLGGIKWEGRRGALYHPAAAIRVRSIGATWSAATLYNASSALEFFTQDGTATDATLESAPKMVLDQIGGLDLNLAGLRLAYYTSADTDITSIVSGSTFGSLIQGTGSGQLVMGLRENGTDDSFAIVSGGGDWQTDNTYDTLVAKFDADGAIKFPGTLAIGTSADAVRKFDVVGPDGVAEGTPSWDSNDVACFRNNGAAGDNAYVVIVAGTTGQTGILFGDVDDRDVGGVKYDNNTDNMIFRTSAGDRVFISNTGQVGIGVAPNADYQFNVLGITSDGDTDGWGSLTKNQIQGTSSGIVGGAYVLTESTAASGKVIDDLRGVYSNVNKPSGTGTITECSAVRSLLNISNNAGSIGNYYGFVSLGGLGTSTTVTNFRHFQANNVVGGTITQQVGLYVLSLTSAATNYGIYIQGATPGYAIYVNAGETYFGGNVGIGVQPTTKLDVSGNIRFDATSADDGLLGYASTTHIFSITRESSDARLSAYTGFQIHAGATTGPTTGTQMFRVSTDGTVMGTGQDAPLDSADAMVYGAGAKLLIASSSETVDAVLKLADSAALSTEQFSIVYDCNSSPATALVYIGDATRYCVFRQEDAANMSFSPGSHGWNYLGTTVLRWASVYARNIYYSQNTNDAGPKLYAVTANSYVQFDDNDYLDYDRSGDDLRFVIGSSTKLSLLDTGDLLPGAASQDLGATATANRWDALYAEQTRTYNSTQAPTSQGDLLIRNQQNLIVARGTIDITTPASPTISGNHWNVASVSNLGTGTYQINLDQAVDPDSEIHVTLDLSGIQSSMSICHTYWISTTAIGLIIHQIRCSVSGGTTISTSFQDAFIRRNAEDVDHIRFTVVGRPNTLQT